MKPKRIRSAAEARRYVAESLAATLRNDLDSGADYLHTATRINDRLEGNLAGANSQALVHEAARRLIAQLEGAAQLYAPRPLRKAP